MGFAFPEEEREALVTTSPHTFQLPKPSEKRFNWVVARLESVDDEEVRDIVFDAWQMVVPKRVAEAYLRSSV